MSHSHKRPVYIPTIENTVVLESSIHGFGLFTIAKIPKDTLMCVLTGQIISKKQLKKLQKLYPKELFVEKVDMGNNKIMLIPFRTSYGYINHSDTKEMLRLESKGSSVLVFAKEDIPYNTEITLIYNMDTHIDVIGGFRKRG